MRTCCSEHHPSNRRAGALTQSTAGAQKINTETFPSVCEATLCAGQPVARTMVKWGGREGLRKGGEGDGEAERMVALC